MTTTHRYLPPAGHRLLLGAYDLLGWLAGAPVVHARLVEQAGIEPGHRVLDLGCGPGAVAVRVARHHPAATVVGLDPDAAALRRARRRGAHAGADVQWRQGFAEDLPFPDDSFDRVLSSLALHHIDPPAVEQALREVRRVLRPGGRAHLADIAAGDHGHRHTHGLIGRLLSRLPGAPDVQPVDLAPLLPAAGFTDVAEVGREPLRAVGVVTFYRAA